MLGKQIKAQPPPIILLLAGRTYVRVVSVHGHVKGMVITALELFLQGNLKEFPFVLQCTVMHDISLIMLIQTLFLSSRSSSGEREISKLLI